MEDEQSSAPVEQTTMPTVSSEQAAETPIAEQTTSPAESTTAETSEVQESTDNEAAKTETDDTTSTETDEAATTDETDNKDSGLKMTREERAEYFKQQQAIQKQHIENSVNEAYKPQSADDLAEYYKEQGYTDGEAAILARDDVRTQEKQIAEARVQIAELNSMLYTQAIEVVNTTPWLDSNNKDNYDKASADAASSLYEMLAVEKDPNTGNVVNAKIEPKQFYSLIDQIRQSGSKQASAEARKAAEAEMASVAAPSSNSNNRETSFNDMSVEEQASYLRAKGHDF